MEATHKMLKDSSGNSTRDATRESARDAHSYAPPSSCHGFNDSCIVGRDGSVALGRFAML
jgi:hypothetical protein